MTNREILHSILIDYFGDANVDFKEDNQILIYFPRVTVTNENDKSIEITKLFVKVVVDEDGALIGTFTMNRAEYTAEQFRSNYLHSHINGIPAKNGFSTEFYAPCLGSGPIKNTCATLNEGFSEDFWCLFCRELSLYVTRESLTGVPYRRLEHVGTRNGRWTKRDLEPYYYDVYHDDSALNDFITYLLEDMPFEFNYVNGTYGVAMSPFEWHIAISNKFIEWYNSQSSDFRESTPYCDFMEITKIEGFEIFHPSYKGSRNNEDLSSYVGKPICTFKDRPITLSITNIGEDTEDENISLMLNSHLCQYVLAQLLKIINFGYGNNRKSSNTSLRSTLSTQINKTIAYL